MIERLSIAAEMEGEVWAYRRRETPWGSHRHAELELNLVTRGKATYVLKDRRYELGIGSAVWLFPGQEHVIARESADLEMWIVVFRPRMVRAAARGGAAMLRRRNPAGAACRNLAAADMAKLHALVGQVHEARAQADTFNAGLKFVLLASWDAFSRAKQLPDGTRVHAAVQAAARLVGEEGATMSVEEIAERVGLSPARLSRLFRAQMGVRLSDLRNRVRLARFMELYGDGTRIKMLSAALRAGFGSYAQFHRVFSGQMGRGPREYMR